ncbi:MAG: carboxymuconolactone decarboxylase family protein [Methylocystis sp.]|nr:carboxymuconolactone decarboxylase family protein [Methylocystis sp.]MCA3584280.1 carboxymuconolactone decarboxylase family protein [Methylocystis sp.]MCA3588312.1 carboxymuconolactone decarboxylase family protein [Methylocystis sp.]MCA3590935.1 carboxymuconolactone decarboxylase family protein [Methylocystis sp.]
MTNDAERIAKGTKNRRKVLGDAHVDRSLKNRTEFNAEWVDFITRYAWGDIWDRPGLDYKKRSVVVLSVTTALGRWEEFRIHVKGAIHNGLTKDEIKEVLMQCAVYAGVPAANTAFHEAQKVFEEMDRAG